MRFRSALVLAAAALSGVLSAAPTGLTIYDHSKLSGMDANLDATTLGGSVTYGNTTSVSGTVKTGFLLNTPAASFAGVPGLVQATTESATPLTAYPFFKGNVQCPSSASAGCTVDTPDDTFFNGSFSNGNTQGVEMHVQALTTGLFNTCMVIDATADLGDFEGISVDAASKFGIGIMVVDASATSSKAPAVTGVPPYGNRYYNATSVYTLPGTASAKAFAVPTGATTARANCAWTYVRAGQFLVGAVTPAGSDVNVPSATVAAVATGKNAYAGGFSMGFGGFFDIAKAQSGMAFKLTAAGDINNISSWDQADDTTSCVFSYDDKAGTGKLDTSKATGTGGQCFVLYAPGVPRAVTIGADIGPQDVVYHAFLGPTALDLNEYGAVTGNPGYRPANPDWDKLTGPYMFPNPTSAFTAGVNGNGYSLDSTMKGVSVMLDAYNVLIASVQVTAAGKDLLSVAKVPPGGAKQQMGIPPSYVLLTDKDFKTVNDAVSLDSVNCTAPGATPSMHYGATYYAQTGKSSAFDSNAPNRAISGPAKAGAGTGVCAFGAHLPFYAGGVITFTVAVDTAVTGAKYNLVAYAQQVFSTTSTEDAVNSYGAGSIVGSSTFKLPLTSTAKSNVGVSTLPLDTKGTSVTLNVPVGIGNGAIFDRAVLLVECDDSTSAAADCAGAEITITTGYKALQIADITLTDDIEDLFSSNPTAGIDYIFKNETIIGQVPQITSPAAKGLSGITVNTCVFQAYAPSGTVSNSPTITSTTKGSCVFAIPVWRAPLYSPNLSTSATQATIAFDPYEDVTVTAGNTTYSYYVYKGKIYGSTNNGNISPGATVQIFNANLADVLNDATGKTGLTEEGTVEIVKGDIVTLDVYYPADEQSTPRPPGGPVSAFFNKMPMMNVTFNATDAAGAQNIALVATLSTGGSATALLASCGAALLMAVALL